MAEGESIRGTTNPSYQGQRDETGGLPNITGRGVSTEYAYKTAPSETSGAFGVDSAGVPADRGGPQSGNSYLWIWWNFDASRSSNAYGKYNRNAVEPFGYWMYHIIKY